MKVTSMPSMTKRIGPLLYLMLFVCGGRLTASAQKIELKEYKITLPEGTVLGVGFDESKEVLFVQQFLTSTGEGGRTILSSRQLSSWRYARNEMSGKRMLDSNPTYRNAYLCRRVEMSMKLNRILICSGETQLDLLDPDTLNTVGQIAHKSGQSIYDFAVDDERGLVFVLTLVGSSRSPNLTIYSLTDGAEQRETKLPPTDGTLMKLALVRKSGKVAVVLDHYVHGPQKSDVYVCESNARFSCTSAALTPRVLDVDVVGNELLGATDKTADRKDECLIGVDLNTHAVSPHEYCSPSTGVHYAVAVANDKYIVGFTGTAKRVWWKEENLSQESSFSVWAVENPKVLALAKEPANFGSNQFGATIFASRTAPLFVARVGNSSELYVYAIPGSR